MEFDILTLFPNMFSSVLGESILSRAIAKSVIQVHLHQIRDYALDKHRTTDDLPYGGGPGMVMKCEPLYGAWQAAKARNPALPTRTILLSPQGQTLSQPLLESWAKAMPGKERLILVCGRYEGIDERFVEQCVDEELSLGDFVLSGGEIPAMALIDSFMRLLPGALGNEASAAGESFSSHSEGLLEGPQYTRPPEFMGRKVPEILLSGDHAKIAAWRREQSRQRTQKKRPDLLSHSKG
jgi:tRNA (guanine37-N1)-methyltransferase